MQQAARDEMAHHQITQAAAYRKETGKCPVCHSRGGHGITCGRIKCIQRWLQIKVKEA